MTKLPKWLLPAGLAAGVVTALALVRKPSIKAGDVVAVKKEVLIPLLAGGQQLPEVIMNLTTQVQKIAVRVTSEKDGVISGQVQGWIDPPSNTPVAPMEGPPVAALPRSAVTDHYRGGKRIG